MHGVTSRACEPLTTTIPSCMWSNKELHGPVTDHRPCRSQLHDAFSGTSLQSYAVTNSLDHKITAAFSLHRFRQLDSASTSSPMLDDLPPNKLNIQPCYPHGSRRHQLASDPASDPACMRLKQSKTDQAGRSTIVLLHRTADTSYPRLQLKVMIVEGYHCSQSCQDTPLPINQWPATVQCGVQMATLQASPSHWIYQTTSYNTHSFCIGVATTTAIASTTPN